MPKYTIKRCVCSRIEFTELKRIAQEDDINTVEAFKQKKIAAHSCGLCIPYIREMLNTGQTAFEPGAVYKDKSA